MGDGVMWINRGTYDALVRLNAKLEAEVEFKKGRIDSLEAEVEYWREKFEREQERGDRTNDRLVSTAGYEPVSSVGIKEADGLRKQYEELMKGYEKQNREMFADEIPGEELEGVSGDLAQAVALSFGR
jgi:hypothetical protein